MQGDHVDVAHRDQRPGLGDQLERLGFGQPDHRGAGRKLETSQVQRLGQALGLDEYAGDGMPVRVPAFMARLDHLEPRRFPDEHGQVAPMVGSPC